MAKQYFDYDHSLVDGGKWMQLVKSLKVGIYEVEVPDYGALRSLQVTVSKVNAEADYPLRMTTSAKYRTLTLRIEVDKR